MSPETSLEGEEPLAPVPLPAPLKPEPVLMIPARIRIGLASDLSRVAFPCCEGELSWQGSGASPIQGMPASRSGTITIEPVVGGGVAVYRLQVAALKDADRASALAVELALKTGLASEAHFDAGVGLYRVRVGRFKSREAAEAGRARVPWSGSGAAFVVSETAELEAPALKLTIEGGSRILAGRWLALTARDHGALRFEGRRYRHQLRVYLNDRGSLNVINELPFEDYLRGVVPKEMGPEQYDRLEALKAQSVAARTYALAHRGQFEQEGFDLCATPSCQVYGGMDAEHPVSDQAVAATRGEVVLYQGQAIEALYTATCGGHTEDVSVVFPGIEAPYLAGLPCIEGGLTSIAAGIPVGTRLAAGVVTRLLPSTQRSPVAAFAERTKKLATLAHLEVPRERLASLERREVMRYLISLFDLVLDPALFAASPGEASLFPSHWSDADRRNAVYLARAGILSGPSDLQLTEQELHEMLFRLSLRIGVLGRLEARFSHLEKAALWVMRAGKSERHTFSGSLLAFQGLGESSQASALSLIPGDPLELLVTEGRVLAVLRQAEGRVVAGEWSGRGTAWTRFKSRKELADQVEQRYPGLGFEGFEVLSRGRSGRVGKIRLLGRGGRAQVVEGLAVRWLLDVPETLFTSREVQPAKGPAGWQFAGKGWGHGVGLCQTGAFGMARQGLTYREILLHYYSGTELKRIASQPAD